MRYRFDMIITTDEDPAEIISTMDGLWDIDIINWEALDEEEQG